MNDCAGWTARQYGLFRLVFGGWLAVHFAALVPWGAELFSSAGALPDAAASPLLRLFPNLFLLADTPAFVTAVLVFATVAAVAFAIGAGDRAAAVLLWWISASLFGRNPLTSNPSLPYVGLLLLVHAGVPKLPPLRALLREDAAVAAWHLPRSLHRVVWILMSAGYSFSGWTKLVSPSWCDGTALARVLENPLARPGGLRLVLLDLPPVVLQAMTWGVLALELGFVLFAASRRLRPFAWLAMLLMHGGLVMVIDFADLSVGMVMLHLFTFDPAWLRWQRQPATFAADWHGS